MPVIDPLLGGATRSLVASSAGALPDPLTGVSPASGSEVAPASTAAPATTAKTVAPTPAPEAATSAPAPLAAAAAPATTAKQVAPTPAPGATTSAPAPLAAAAPAAPVLAPVTAAALPPAPLTPASAYAGTRTPLTYERFASQFRIELEDINHLLKLANPAKYGKFFATDVFGKQYEISGVRTINSFGNNLSNAGADLKYGTADDIKSTMRTTRKTARVWVLNSGVMRRFPSPASPSLNGAP